MEGDHEEFQGLDVALECGKVGEFTVSLTATSDDTSSTATATGTLIALLLLHTCS